VSELAKAKYAARDILLHNSLGIHLFWNETWNNQFLSRSIGLFRNGFSADPDSPMTPQAAYYVIRTLCGVMDGAEPAQVAVELSNKDQTLETHGFRSSGGELLVALWLHAGEPGFVFPGESGQVSRDDFEPVKTDVTLPAIAAKRVVGIDLLNGVEQELKFAAEGGKTVIRDLLVPDYPVMLRIQL
jgi:hypothetical protein